MKSAIKRAAQKGTSTQVVKKARQQQKTLSKRNVPRNLTSVNLGIGFPKRLVATLKYGGTFTITSTNSLAGFYQFSCNGLYDPNITGTGHQPMYFDNLMAVYDHYTVIGSKVTATVVPNSASDGPGAFSIFINDDTTTSAGTFISDVSEQSSGTPITVLPIGQSMPLKVVKTWSAKQTFGGSVLGNDNLQGTASANPLEQSYYQFAYQDLRAAGTSTVTVIVNIEYTAVFDELKDQAAN